MVEMTQVAEKENAAETLLQAKGFLNPVVSITDGQVDSYRYSRLKNLINSTNLSTNNLLVLSPL